MGRFTILPPEEIERRRLASVEVLKDLERDEFERWYQKRCDEDYWKFGQRCSGCDYWASSAGWIGECQKGGKLSGYDALASAGIICCSKSDLGPAYPLTRAWDYCAWFKDDFDWSVLDTSYLNEIGAMRNGVLRQKPKHRARA